MTITKLGHCCLVVEIKSSAPTVVGAPPLRKEESRVRIMTDPGAYSILQNNERNIDFVFITHEHQDHFHLESLKKVLANNPKAKVVTNRAVGKLLEKEKIAYELLEDGASGIFSGIQVEGCGDKHAVIYREYGQVQNTGYFFAGRLFYPGDAFYDPACAADVAAGGPKKPVEILALPVSGPWMKISEAIEYAKSLKPKICFPVHDGMLKFKGPNHAVPEKILSAEGISFVVIEEGTSREF